MPCEARNHHSVDIVIHKMATNTTAVNRLFSKSRRSQKSSKIRKGVPELRGPGSFHKKIGFIFSKNNSVSPVLASIHPILAYNVPRTDNVGLPTKFRFNVGPASQLIADSMSVNRLRRWPNSEH